MGLYEPDKSNFFLPKHGFLVDPENLEFIVDEVKTGKVVWLPPKLVEKIAPGLSANPNAMYCACSGVSVSHNYSGNFRQGQSLLAVEMVRYESNPVVEKKEPNFNLNRYIFGVSQANDKAYGIDVTTWKSNPVTGQVGNHWDEIDEYVKSHFPKQHDGGEA
jgi:hypothetical protein